MLAINVENVSDLAIVECKGRIVRSESVFKLRDVVRAQAEARIIALDLSAVEAIGGGGLGMLAFLDRWARDHDIQLKLFSPSRSVVDGLVSNRSILHFARQSAHRAVIEPIRNPALLGLLQPFDGTLLLLKISGILDFSFDGLKLVPDFRRRVSFKKTRHQIPQNRRQLLDSNLRPFKQLRQRLPHSRSEIDCN